jgi:hypothetical protein
MFTVPVGRAPAYRPVAAGHHISASPEDPYAFCMAELLFLMITVYQHRVPNSMHYQSMPQ